MKSTNQTTCTKRQQARAHHRIVTMMNAIGYSVQPGIINHKDGRVFTVQCLLKRA